MARVLHAANLFYRDREGRRRLAVGFFRIPDATVLRRVTILVSLFFVAPILAHAGTCPTASTYWNAAGTSETSTLASLGVTDCHYISSASGSDSNTGADESQPWAHLPGMPDCAGNCAAITPGPGDGFILRGGDSWLAADLGVLWKWGGSASNYIYIGVDKGWYAGTSWRRPIFNCQNTQCSAVGDMFQFWAYANGYITLDNIEFTGFQEGTSPGSMVRMLGTYQTVEDCYFHGWSHVSSGYTTEGRVISTLISSGTPTGDEIHDNVIDGSDTSKDMMRGIFNGWSVFHNVVRYTVAEIDGQFNYVYGNLVENDVLSVTGLHYDLILQYGPVTGSVSYLYNNVIRNEVAKGGGDLWINGMGTAASPAVTYAYNNVLYNVSTGGITVGGHSNLGNTGTYYIYNNTVDEAGSGGYCMGNGESGSSSTTYYSNNHCINATGVCDGVGTTCVDQGGNLFQTESQANTDGYTATETYAYSPTSSSSSTVAQGVNYASMCSGPLLPLCSDTTYPTYDAANHTVVMRTVNNRPPLNGGKWDIGAYEFSNSLVQAPQPPTSLQATVH